MRRWREDILCREASQFKAQSSAKQRQSLTHHCRSHVMSISHYTTTSTAIWHCTRHLRSHFRNVRCDTWPQTSQDGCATWTDRNDTICTQNQAQVKRAVSCNVVASSTQRGNAALGPRVGILMGYGLMLGVWHHSYLSQSNMLNWQGVEQRVKGVGSSTGSVQRSLR